MPEIQERSTPALLGDLLDHATELMRKEVQLLRAEMADKASRAAVATGVLVGAAIIAMTALNVLAAALVTALTEAGLRAPWAAVIVGVVLAVVAYVMANRGVSGLKASNLQPERTVRSTARDAAMLKEKL